MSKNIIDTVGSAITYLTSKATPGLALSEHNFAEFAPLFELNDRISHELAQGLSEADAKAYELDPPRVIVVGLTSAGKSSLLERVIGHKIFPVCDNVCTRRPFRCQIKKSHEDRVGLRFLNSKEHGSDKVFSIPDEIDDIRGAIEQEQASADQENVTFSSKEITAEVTTTENQSFTFTDLPGVFLVSETKMGGDYAESRKQNESLKHQTIDIIKKYLRQKNTIVLVVVSATDWMHGMNNDNLIGYLAEWLEDVRREENREVPVYGVITKLDTQTSGLSENSPLKKVLLGQLPQNHILNGLGARKWIPMVSSPDILASGAGDKAAKMERDAIVAALQGSIPAATLAGLPMGRTALLNELKGALLQAIGASYGGMRRRIDGFVEDVSDKLKRVPAPAPANEKRRIFESNLKALETSLTDLIGPGGKHLSAAKGERSLRMQLMVDAARKFESDLQSANLRGDMVAEVAQLVDLAMLEQGGSFDSDVTFNSISQKIIDRFSAPCMGLVEAACSIVTQAIRTACDQVFSEYPGLLHAIASELGALPGGVRSSQGGETATDGNPKELVTFLRHSASEKVHGILDAFSMMTSCHPMWRSFDDLYEGVLRKRADKAKVVPAAEQTLQTMLGLPELAERATLEGEVAIAMYEKNTKEKLSPATKAKIAKHFARIEVMGYIIRMSLISTVFPLVLRDLRDGLFRGVRFGGVQYDCSVVTLLRSRLMFDQKKEQLVMQMMDPSPADMAMRIELEKKRGSLFKLKTDFDDCSANLARLHAVLQASCE